jgi:dCMP deaminase
LNNIELKDKFKPIMMQTAKSFASLSYAERKKVGAVVCDYTGRILLTGYNGTLTNTDNLCEIETDEDCNICNAGHLLNEETATLSTCSNCNHDGKVLRTHDYVLHAEMNIIAHSSKLGIPLRNTIMFVTLSPCTTCAKLIIQSGIKEVYYAEEYRDLSGVEFLQKHIICEQLD